LAKQQTLLRFQYLGVAIPGNRELRACLPQAPGRSEVRHSANPFAKINSVASNQPNPTTRDAGFLQLRASQKKAAPDRFAKSAARKVSSLWPRRQKMLLYSALRKQVKTLAHFCPP
jgi:hypothetical protein